MSSADIDIPIALRKGVRACTQHPIEKYVSQGYRAFVAGHDNINIPTIFCTLGVPSGFNIYCHHSHASPLFFIIPFTFDSTLMGN